MCVNLALTLTESIPPSADRWLGEPIKAVVIPTSLFVTNRKGVYIITLTPLVCYCYCCLGVYTYVGFPVLKMAHQTFLKKLFRVHSLCISYR